VTRSRLPPTIITGTPSGVGTARNPPRYLKDGDTVTVETLVLAGVVSKPRDGVKILGSGELKAGLVFQVAGASKSALAAIEAAGGRVEILGAAVAEASA
jgi:large subunit ribosomal protein L15